MNVFKFPEGTYLHCSKSKKTNKQPTPRKRPEALSSRHTVDSLCFRNNPFLFGLLPAFPLLVFSWFHCGATVPTD